MIDWYVLVFLECDTIELVSQSEHTFNHFRQLEVRP